MNGLKAMRKERGLTQAFVAGKLGVPQQYLCRYENGSNTMPVTYVRPLAEIYGTSVEAVFNAAYPAQGTN